MTDRTVLPHRHDEEYDSMNVLEIVEGFNALLTQVQSIYDENETMLKKCEDEELDLLHYAELSHNLNASQGYKLYKNLSRVLRERRRCKDENELLTAVYAFAKENPRLINQISTLLGKTRGTKRCIDQRIYQARTNII